MESLITVLTEAHNCSLPWARRIQSTVSHLMSLRSILILSSHLRLRLPSCLFSWGFPTKILFAFLISPKRPTYPDHIKFFNLTNLIIFAEGYKLRSSSPCPFLPLESKYSPQHPVLHLVWGTKLHSHTNPKALGYGLDGGGYRVRFLAGAGNFFFTTASVTALVPTHPPIQWVRGGSFPGGKAARAWSWPLTSI